MGRLLDYTVTAGRGKTAEEGRRLRWRKGGLNGPESVGIGWSWGCGSG